MNIVSYAFFRHPASAYESERCGESRGRFFINYFRALVRAHQHVWSSWTMLIHHDGRVMELPYFKALERMQELRLVTLRYCGDAKTLCGSMLWRLNAVFAENAETVVCRDVDSLPMPRDRAMVDEFSRSGAILHAIHDSKSHCGPLMGGTLGINAPEFRRVTGHTSFETLLEAGRNLGLDYDVHGSDQAFLNSVVYPYLAPSTLIHTSRDVGQYPAQATLPVHERKCSEDRLANHVGGAFDVDRAVTWYDAYYAQTNPKLLKAIADCEGP